MKKLIVTSLLLWGPLALGASETQLYDASKIKKLVVKTSSGDINVVATTGKKASVVANKVEFSDSCEMTQKLEKNTLVINVSGRSKGWFNFTSCRVNFDISVHKNTSLTLKGGSSNLQVAGIKAPVLFKLGSGDVKLNVASKKVTGRTGSGNIQARGALKNAKLKTGSGNIDIKGLVGSASVKSGSGNINLTYKKALSKGVVEMKTGSGNANLNLPSGMEVFAKMRSGSGLVSNQAVNNPKSQFKVSMKSGSGNININSIK